MEVSGSYRGTLGARAGVLCILIACIVLSFCGCNRTGIEEENLYNEAEKALAEGRFADAIGKFSDLVDAYPNSQLAPESQYKIGYVYWMHLGNRREALNAYAVLLYVYPESDRLYRAREDRAEILSGAENSRGAIEEYIWLVERGPWADRDRYRYKLALEYIKLNDFIQGRIELQDLLKFRPNTRYAPLVYQNIASSYFLEGKYPEAVKAYEEVIKMFPNEPVAKHAKIEKASALVADRSLKEALEWLLLLEKEYPNDTVVKIKIYAVRERLKDETIEVKYPDGDSHKDMLGGAKAQ